MGKIYCIMGKSASGKDTIFKKLKEDKTLNLKTIIPYTTRPIRAGETNGIEYFFVNEEQLQEYEDDNKVIEKRAYHTVHGIWNYFILNDGQIDVEHENYIMIGTLESFIDIQKFYGENIVKPIYIELEDGVRLSRALEREQKQKEPKYLELCRRFISDSEDFSEENIKKCNIKKRYNNEDMHQCIHEIKLEIYDNSYIE